MTSEVWPISRAPQWPERSRVQFRLIKPDGTPLHDWPLQSPVPSLDDLIELPSGRYRVIRRRWDLSQSGLIALEMVVDDQPI
jgi:hypothetical protein